MPPALPLITLLTDFGTKDYFVASMKGVILTINPDARIIDITHDISPHQIAEAAYCLQASYRTFPEGTVHVAVVDPGVGSSRRPILVTTSRYYFVAPDNGVLTPVLSEEQGVEIRQLENRQYQLESSGATFHGRDLFAPAAAWLTKGAALPSFGRPVVDPVKLHWPKPTIEDSQISGEVVYVDQFGNLISNISDKQIHALAGNADYGQLEVSLGEYQIRGMANSYSMGDSANPGAILNSDGLVEVFLKERSASAVLHIGVGMRLVIRHSSATSCILSSP